MNKRQKNTSILIYFAKQKRKESTAIEEHKQETSRPPCSTSRTSQSTELASAEEHINLGRPNTVIPRFSRLM